MKIMFVLSKPGVLRSKTSTIAFLRIIRWIEKNIKGVSLCDKVTNGVIQESRKCDIIVIVYSAYYADYKGLSRLIYLNHKKRLFFLINEYGLSPNADVNTALRTCGYEVIANYDEGTSGINHYVKFHQVNLNVSAFYEMDNKPFHERTSKLIYWGRYRRNREKYFKKYFHDITISTSQKNKRSFLGLRQKNTIIDRLCLCSNYRHNKKISKSLFPEVNDIENYRYTIYIEDEYTHTHYNHLADRFYEAVSHGLIIFFDSNTKNTVRRSGYHIPNFYFVSSREEIDDKIQAIESEPYTHVELFRNLKLDIRLERREVIERLNNIFSEGRKINPHICGHCLHQAKKLILCTSCRKQICSVCIMFRKRFLCPACYDPEKHYVPQIYLGPGNGFKAQ